MTGTRAAKVAAAEVEAEVQRVARLSSWVILLTTQPQRAFNRHWSNSEVLHQCAWSMTEKQNSQEDLVIASLRNQNQLARQSK